MDNEIQKLQRLREQYFDTRGDKAQKYTLQHEFHRTKELIKTEYSSFGERWKIESFLEQVDDWNPFDDSHTSSFFSPGWMFGINDGFDVVIANPPYVGQKGHKEIFQQIKDSELGRLYHQRRMNLFYFFIHQSLINLKTSGILTFITTNYYLTATYADKLRKHIYDDATILSLINFNELKVFESAQGQHNLITMLKKGKFLEVIAKTCITQKQGIANESVIAKIINGEDPDTEYNKQSQKSLFEGGTLYIRIESQKKSSSGANNVFAILNKMKVGSDLLCKYCEIEQGIVSGADKVSESHIKDYPQYNLQKGKGIYVLTNKEISDLGFTNDDKKYLKKTYKNSEIRKWVVSAKDDLNVIYIKSDGEYFEPNIRIKNHLDGFKIILINRNVRVGSITEKDYQEFLKDKKEISYIMNASSMKKGNYYCLSYARRALDTFEVLKIVNSRRAYSNTFALEDKGYYEQSDIVVTTLKPEYVKTINIKYFLAILNSKLLYAWLYHKGKRKGEQLEIFQKPLSEVPVKVGSFSIQEKIVSLVNNIFEAKKTNSNVETDKCEKEIDILVYKLYGLTHNGVKIIDPDFWLSEEEYKKFGVK
ncbi:MAG: Eco57I restriction-modification methylase domain-containing protein [Bacteroidetes bacterium]|nr:Eco57I restriction-modification methylase domain-containing protein [Bacteroidota bacterium]